MGFMNYRQLLLSFVPLGVVLLVAAAAAVIDSSFILAKNCSVVMIFIMLSRESGPVETWPT